MRPGFNRRALWGPLPGFQLIAALKPLDCVSRRLTLRAALLCALPRDAGDLPICLWHGPGGAAPAGAVCVAEPLVVSAGWLRGAGQGSTEWVWWRVARLLQATGALGEAEGHPVLLRMLFGSAPLRSHRPALMYHCRLHQVCHPCTVCAARLPQGDLPGDHPRVWAVPRAVRDCAVRIPSRVPGMGVHP